MAAGGRVLAKRDKDALFNVDGIIHFDYHNHNAIPYHNPRRKNGKNT